MTQTSFDERMRRAREEANASAALPPGTQWDYKASDGRIYRCFIGLEDAREKIWAHEGRIVSESFGSLPASRGEAEENFDHDRVQGNGPWGAIEFPVDATDVFPCGRIAPNGERLLQYSRWREYMAEDDIGRYDHCRPCRQTIWFSGVEGAKSIGFCQQCGNTGWEGEIPAEAREAVRALNRAIPPAADALDAVNLHDTPEAQSAYEEANAAYAEAREHAETVAEAHGVDLIVY